MNSSDQEPRWFPADSAPTLEPTVASAPVEEPLVTLPPVESPTRVLQTDESGLAGYELLGELWRRRTRRASSTAT